MATKKKKLVDDVALTHDQRYLNDERLPKSGIEIEWTPERIAELEKSRKDLKYFAEKYFFIVTLDEVKG